MATTFKVLAGDFRAKESFIRSGRLQLFDPSKTSFFPDVLVPMTEIASVEIATEEDVRRAAGTVGWAAAGGLLLGPIGLLGGALLGGRGTDVTFICTLGDGRTFLASASSGTYAEFLKAVMARSSQTPPNAPPAVSRRKDPWTLVYSEAEFPTAASLLGARGAKGREAWLFSQTGGWKASEATVIYPQDQLDLARLDEAILNTRGFRPVASEMTRDGRLVRFSRRLTSAGAPAIDLAALVRPETKTCPQCAEDVKAAARICRFCRYEFPESKANA